MGARVDAPSPAPCGSMRRWDALVARLVPSFGDLIFCVLLLGGLFVFQGSLLGTDGDIGWDLRLGALILTHGLPRSEPLLETVRGAPTVHWEWLAQVCFALADRLGGLNGVVALAALLVAVTGAGLWVVLRTHQMPLLVALPLTLLGMLVVVTAWTARAELFSLPLTLWWCAWLRAYWRDGATSRLIAFPAATALWANLHAGFVTALLLLSVAVFIAWLLPGACGNARRLPLTGALVGSVLATLCTPWGTALDAHILAFARDPLVAASTSEYQHPRLDEWPVWVALALLAALVMAWLVLWRGQVRARRGLDRSTLPITLSLDLALVGVWTALACSYVRFLPLWPLVALPALAAALEPSWPALGRRAARAGQMRWLPIMWRYGRTLEVADARVGRGVWSALTCVGVLLLLVCGGALPGVRTSVLDAQFNARDFPVAAVARLRTEGLPSGRGFNPYEWGGYLEYALPGAQVFIDSRSDVYGEGLLRDYLTIITLAPGWRTLLDQYVIAWALLPQGSPLADALARSPGWHCAAEDAQGVAVLCRRASSRGGS